MNTSFVGRGRETAVPERGLPFDVQRRAGLLKSNGAADERTVADVFLSWNWHAGNPMSGERTAAPGDLRQPSRQFFALFPWDGREGN